MSNILDMGKDKKFPKEGELAKRLGDLVDEYRGELATVSVIGILELQKGVILHNAFNGVEE